MKRGVYRLASLVWLMAFSRVFAAGLGDIEVHSSLGERLDARVAVLGVSSNEAEQLLAQLAPLTIYRQSGVEFPTVLHSVSVRVETSGELVFLRLNSSERINEPIIDLLLQVAAPNGELQRQFTLLLDLPKITDAAVDARISLPSKPEPSPELMPTEAVATLAADATPISEAPSSATATVVTTTAARDSVIVANRYGPVKRRETLWLIANKIKQQVQQSQATVMAGLFKANQQAFLNANPNQLMEGSLLQIPAQWPSETLAQLSNVAPKVNASNSVEPTSSNTALISAQANREPAPTAVVLSEQNRQLRGEISQLSLRIAELENRLSQQVISPPTAETSIEPALPPEEKPAIALAENNQQVQTQVLTPPVDAVEIRPTPAAIAPPKNRTEQAKPTIRTPNKVNFFQQNWMWFLSGLILLSIALFFWLHRDRKSLKPAFLDELAWQERKRSARAARHAERNIPTPQDWHSSEPIAEAPNTAETMEIKLQYVRSAVDTFLLFQRYNEALAFIRREIFEAGHESPLGHRLDGLYRETKEHLRSLGIEESLPNGEAKMELASSRRDSDDKHVVTPLRKARQPNRRDLI